MKLKANIKAIEMLVATKPEILPTYSSAFRDLFVNLREIVRENIGYTEAKTLEYDETGRTFYFEVSKRTVVGQHYGTFMATFHLDPRRGLMAQLQAAVEDIEIFKTECFAAEQRYEAEKKVRDSLKKLP